MLLMAYANNALECGAFERGGHIENCTPLLSLGAFLIAEYIRCKLLRLNGMQNVSYVG